MKKLLNMLLTAVFISGCSLTAPDRLYFVEKNHMGLKVEAEPQSETPGMVNFGYKRKMATLIPCRSIDQEENYCKSVNDDEKNEILSVISVFKTRVTWFSGTSIHTYFATGEAADNTAKSADAVKALVRLPPEEQ